MDRTGGKLDLEYWGFDAALEIRILDPTSLRVTASAGALSGDAEVSFNPNFLIRPGEPMSTGSGERLDSAPDARPWRRTGKEMGGWFGQGRWRAEVPPEAMLRFPVRPYSPDGASKPAAPVAVLSVPVGNREVALVLKIAAGRGWRNEDRAVSSAAPVSA
jgi:hypothetical protein